MNGPPAQPIPPTLEALNARSLPQWYDDAKFGIFIHWGLFSIPAFAPRTGSITDAFKSDYARAVAMVPYTEWYANAIKIAGTPSAGFHAAEFGNRPYTAFKQDFLDGLKQWQPHEWAETFRAAGAKYVVLVTKHHDGFCLWPSGVANPHEPDWFTARDVVGELAAAVRANGMRFGVYYSGGIDWTFNREPLRTLFDFLGSMPGGDYPAYAMAQARELIARYGPDVLWNDISWPTGLDPLLGLFADYYTAVPEGVVNDRWAHAKFATKLLRRKTVRRVADYLARRYIDKHPEAVNGVVPQAVPHSDFRTPEYTTFKTIQKRKWEATRGMSHSFGFNRNDREEDYAPGETLLADFIDAVAKGGNLLLNVGPRGSDAQIPAAQLARLKLFGAWLAENGHAIYGTRPWQGRGDTPEAETACGLPVRFTQSGDTVHLIVLGKPTGTRLAIRNLALSGSARVSDGAPVTLETDGPDLVLNFGKPLDGRFAPVISIETGIIAR